MGEHGQHGWGAGDAPPARVADARPNRAAAPGLFARLRGDVRGNTLAIMAAALIPITAIAGSAVDMARIHVVKVRLQQACDAGVLAGRRFLPNGTAEKISLVTDNSANQDRTKGSDGRSLYDDGTQALTYFTNNLETSWTGAGWYTASSDKFNATTVKDTQQNVQVGGTASASVPMALMSMFGFAAQTVSVTCQASFSTPDTDVMFVLDTTGSMGCAVTRPESSCSSDWVPNNGGTYTNNGTTGYLVKEETSGSSNISRIDALRQAVIAFYTTVATKKDKNTNVRYGFVPYTSTVNVGSLLYGLNPNYLVSKWSYQSRTPTDDYVISTVSTTTASAADQNACNAYASRTPANRVDPNTGDANAGYPSSGTATRVYPSWTTNPNKCTLTTNKVGPVWGYQPAISYDVSKYVKGNTITDPSRLDGSTTTWNGCIEERDTTPGVTDFSKPPLPGDLDPDLVPSTDATRWRPMWSDVVYERYFYTYNNNDYGLTPWNSYNVADNVQATLWNYNDAKLAAGGGSSCPAQALPLFLPSDQSSGLTTVTNYVNGLHALGGTYHDVGMIWGTRMLSPTGLWQNNNAWQVGRAAPKRMIVFVTDGTMSPSSQLYGGYSVEYPDRRVTGTYFGSGNPNPDAGRNSDGTCTNASANCSAYINFHNQRFLAECARAKSSPLNFDIWVVEVAQASSTALTACASRPSQVLPGQTPDNLKSSFLQIAAQVAMLRVSQ